MNEELFFCEISDLLQKARQKTYQSINSLIVETYWQIGKRIVEQEQNGKDRANYGEHLITRLSVYLGEQLGKGFSVANLKNFRQFYLVFPKRKSYTLCSQLSWSHIRLIMRLDDENARIYYLNETKEQNWSVRQLALFFVPIKMKLLLNIRFSKRTSIYLPRSIKLFCLQRKS